MKKVLCNKDYELIRRQICFPFYWQAEWKWCKKSYASVAPHILCICVSNKFLPLLRKHIFYTMSSKEEQLDLGWTFDRNNCQPDESTKNADTSVCKLYFTVVLCNKLLINNKPGCQYRSHKLIYNTYHSMSPKDSKAKD